MMSLYTFIISIVHNYLFVYELNTVTQIVSCTCRKNERVRLMKRAVALGVEDRRRRKAGVRGDWRRLVETVVKQDKL